MRAPALVAVTLACTAAGCSKSDLSDAAFVDGLRLLGAQAEPPEAAPGEMVTLRAWVVDPHGGSIAVTWSACLLPGNGVANPACTDGSGDSLVALGSGETLTVVVPPVERAALGPPDVTDGVYVPIVVHVSGSKEALDAVYRLRLAGTQARNHNPTLALIDGLPDDPEPTHQGQQWTLIARYGGQSVEHYRVASTGSDVDETLTTQWFASGGTFPNQPVGGTAVQTLSIDRALPPTGGTIDLWVVGHDERGGTAMLHHTLIMR